MVSNHCGVFGGFHWHSDRKLFLQKLWIPSPILSIRYTVRVWFHVLYKKKKFNWNRCCYYHNQSLKWHLPMPLEWSQEREEEMGLISKAFEGIDQALLLIMKSWMNIQQKSYWISFGWMFQAFVFENISHKFSAWKLHWWWRKMW